MFNFGVFSYFSISGDRYQWTVSSIFDNSKCNFSKIIDCGFSLRAGYILQASELIRLTRFLVSLVGKV